MQRASTEHRLPVLVSYAFLKDSRALAEAVLSAPGLELLLDSGAFTALNAGAEIKLADYIEFLREWQGKLFGYMALDKLQDPAATDANLQVMLRECLKPVPIHVFGDDGARMDQLFEWSDWVALGGLRRPHRGLAPLTYVRQKMAWAKGRKVHWLGYVRADALRAFKPFSADCSSFASGVRYGNVHAYAGRGEWLSFSSDQVAAEKPYLRARVRQLLDDYDVPVERFVDPRYWRNGVKSAGISNRDCVAMVLPCRSWVRYVMELKRETGVRLFIASIPGSLPHVLDAFEWWKGKYGGDSNACVRDDEVRGLPPVAGRAGRGGIPPASAPARLPCPRREGRQPR
jgi:hypothetical protein